VGLLIFYLTVSRALGTFTLSRTLRTFTISRTLRTFTISRTLGTFTVSRALGTFTVSRTLRALAIGRAFAVLIAAANGGGCYICSLNARTTRTLSSFFTKSFLPIFVCHNYIPV
jgi:hypothetical protein